MATSLKIVSNPYVKTHGPLDLFLRVIKAQVDTKNNPKALQNNTKSPLAKHNIKHPKRF